MNLGIYANIEKPKVRETCRTLCLWAKQKDLSILTTQSLRDLLPKDHDTVEIVKESDFIARSDMVLVMGGDGTMLAAARLIGRAETPLMGVNLGRLGFLAEVSINELTIRMDQILAGDYKIQERLVIQAEFEIGAKSQCLYALNDVVLARGGTPRVVKIEVHVDDQYFNTYWADGMIVATPTGSTAYSLSAAGPILLPSMESIILNPICPHTLTARPTVLPARSIVKIHMQPSGEQGFITVDGQVNIALDSETVVTVKRGDYHVKTIAFPDQSYFDVLRQKLQWGSGIRK